MSSKINKSDYVAVPCDEPKQEPIYNKENNISPCGTCNQRFVNKSWKQWKKALIIFMFVFLGSRVLFSGIDYYSQDSQFIEIPSCSRHVFMGIPNEPACDPTYKWNGPSEFLIDPHDISGLIFSVKGMSAHGSVLIRHDSDSEFITIKNDIYFSEESLQNEIDVKIDIIDEDYTITIETPSFDGPRPTTKCVIVDTIISFPKEVNFWRSFLIDVPNGIIVTENLKNIEFAYVNLKTRNGNIKTKHLNSAISEIATINGHVLGSYLTGEALDIRTVNGAVTIDSFISEWSEYVEISTKSINGHLDVVVPNLRENQSIDLKAASVNGGISVAVPDSYVGNFTATTLIGYAYVEGRNITFTKNLRNAKIGYKTNPDDDDDDDSDTKYKSHHQEFDSNLVLEAVTGAAELYFV